MVCARDGVVVVESRRSGWLHTDDIPKGHEPHDVDEVTSREEWEAGQARRTNLHGLAAELIEHHTVAHPFSDCEFSQRLAEALRLPSKG